MISILNCCKILNFLTLRGKTITRHEQMSTFFCDLVWNVVRRNCTLLWQLLFSFFLTVTNMAGIKPKPDFFRLWIVVIICLKTHFNFEIGKKNPKKFPHCFPFDFFCVVKSSNCGIKLIWFLLQERRYRQTCEYFGVEDAVLVRQIKIRQKAAPIISLSAMVPQLSSNFPCKFY